MGRGKGSNGDELGAQNIRVSSFAEFESGKLSSFRKISGERTDEGVRKNGRMESC
jgi:hypothetical protein